MLLSAAMNSASKDQPISSVLKVKVDDDGDIVDIEGFANEYSIVLPDKADSDREKVVLLNEFTGEKIRLILAPDENDPRLDISLRFDDQEIDLEFNNKRDFIALDDEVLVEDVKLELEPQSESLNRLLSFSGGGWNSHSTLAGLLSGAMDVSGVDLQSLFEKIDSVSANSGGTWFLSHLAYSSSFRSALENRDLRDAYNSSGYNGEVRKAFSGLGPDMAQRALNAVAEALGISPDKLVRKGIAESIDFVVGLVGNALEINKLNWGSFVDQFVYGYESLADMKSADLNSDRQAWAVGKDLSFATAISAYPAIIHNQGGLTQDKLFTAAKPDQLPSWWGQAKRKPSVLPLLIVSDSDSAGNQVSPYAEFPFGNVELTFSSNELFGPSPRRASVAASFNPKMSIIDATTASSSAAAVLAAPSSYGDSTLLTPAYNVAASYLRELAPLATFKDKSLRTPKEASVIKKNQTLDDNAESMLARLADGGYVDNTAVGYGLRQLQRSDGLAAPFEITLLMNSSVDPVTMLPMPLSKGQLSSYKVQPDVAKLFGFDVEGKKVNDGVIEFEGLPTKPTVPSPWIFDVDAWAEITQPEWSFSADGGSYSSQYFKLPVTTVDNDLLGIRAGQKGVLHLFSTNNSQSFAAPVTPSVLNEYDQNYDFGRLAMATGGWRVLADSLGLDLAV